MNVYHVAADDSVRRLSGPADVYTVADGEIVLAGDAPRDERDPAHWAPALGLAAMRGVTVRRKA